MNKIIKFVVLIVKTYRKVLNLKRFLKSFILLLLSFNISNYCFYYLYYIKNKFKNKKGIY